MPEKLIASKPSKIKDDFERLKRGGKAISKEDKPAMLKKIEQCINAGIKSHADIYHELEESGTLPKINGKYVSFDTVSNYICYIRRINGVEGRKLSKRIVSLFNDEKTINQIRDITGSSVQYIRWCLLNEGLINRKSRQRGKEDLHAIKLNIPARIYDLVKDTSERKGVYMSVVLTDLIENGLNLERIANDE